MSREFRIANYEKTLKLNISLGEALPPNHLARFIVDIIPQYEARSTDNSVDREE